jgi:hypothetical protein
MRFHSQNLNEKSFDRNGPMLRHGRCWLSFGTNQPRDTEFRMEWSFFRHGSLGFGVDLAGYDDGVVDAHIALGYIGAVYFGFKNLRLRRVLERLTSRDSEPTWYGPCVNCGKEKGEHDGRECHLSFVHAAGAAPGSLYRSTHFYWQTSGRSIGAIWQCWTLSINLWNDPMEWRSGDPWWWHITIHPVDLLLGHNQYEERTMATERVLVPMPEGAYPATVRMFESTWNRKRWPWPRRLVRAEITPDSPIPFPGKGENAWDCGEDSSHSMTTACETPLDAAMAMARSVMNDRLRYGSGWNYRPERTLAS